MLGYKDMTYCTAKCGNQDCFRQLTDKVFEDGKRWWGHENFPIYTADFKERCDDWKEKEDE